MANKKIYLGIGILAAVALLAGGIFYWRSQKAAVSQTESEMSYEEEALQQDFSELEQLSQDTSLDQLDEDLSSIAGEEGGQQPSTAAVDVSSIENTESELSQELDSLSADLSDLEEIESDDSLSALDAGLSEIGQ